MNRTFISLLALVAATPALAQSNPSVPTKDAAGNDIVVTASRSGDGVEINDLPASVTLITGEQLQERQTRIVSDVLRDVPGLAVSRVGGIGGQTQVRVRGSEANHVLVLIDGIKASDPYQGEFDFGTLIADEAAKIEVLRGQQSALYGSDAIGGVIQYITLTGREQPGFTARVEGGSFGTVSGGARFAGFTDTLDYTVSSSVYQTDGTPTARGGVRDVGSTNVGASAKVTWTPSSIFKVTGVGRYSYTDADTNNTENDPASPLYGTVVDSPGVHFKNKAFYGLVRADLSLADGRWTNALIGQIADSRRRGYTDAGLNNGDNGRRYKASFESSYRFDTGRLVNRITGAIDYEREEFQTVTPSPSPFVFTGRRSTENVGFVGQYEGTIDDALALGASVRRDENNRFDDVTTFRVQAGYRLPFGLRVRGAYGTGVKNPGYFELYGYDDGRYIGNPNLKPEKSKGWEAGPRSGLCRRPRDDRRDVLQQPADGRDLHDLSGARLHRDARQSLDRVAPTRCGSLRVSAADRPAALRPRLHLPPRARERGGRAAAAQARRQRQRDGVQRRQALFWDAHHPLQRTAGGRDVHRSDVCDHAARLAKGVRLGEPQCRVPAHRPLLAVRPDREPDRREVRGGLQLPDARPRGLRRREGTLLMLAT